MTYDTLGFIFVLCGLILNLIVFRVFGQTTVRRLRKNPATKNALGIEFISGMSTLNVLTALAFPKRLMNIVKKTSLAPFYADADLLEKYTTLSDRVLAKIHLYLSLSSGLALFIFLFLLEIVLFDKVPIAP